MKVLVTGASGQLGWEVVKHLRILKIECRGVDSNDFDLTDANAVVEYVSAYAPDAIIHCAAYTAVDKAETEPEVCCRVNGMGTVNLVRAAKHVNAKLLYVSTDYVFSGEGDAPHEVNEHRRPLNIYGQSKFQGEEAVQSLMTRYFIVRTSWVFGMHGEGFAGSILRLSGEKREISVVSDQIGSPAYAPDLARLLCEMIRTNRYGVYHATCEGECSRAELAQAIIAAAGRRCRVRLVSTADITGGARRPLNSRLSMRSLDQAGFARLPDWRSAVTRYVEEVLHP